MTSREAKAPIVQLSAYEDIASIADRLERSSGAEAAERATDRILGGIDLLAGMPYLGPLHQDSVLGLRGYRKLVVSPYVVVYRVEDDQAVVLRVFHGASDYARRVEG